MGLKQPTLTKGRALGNTKNKDTTKSYSNHEAYFAMHPLATRQLLAQIQKEVEARVPGSLQCISYNMPAYKLGRTFIYFAAFKKHIGIYPPITQDQGLIKDDYRISWFER